MKNLILKSFKDINFIAIVVVAICYCILMDNADNDFWGRLFSGATYLDNGWVLYKDIFSFAPTKSIWVDHEWLSGIIFFLVLKNFGVLGILGLKCFLTTLLLWVIYLAARLRLDTDKNILYLVVILFALGPGIASNIRPHDFTYIFFAFWILILDHSRINDTSKYLWLLPVSIILWANLHAGCIAGLALLAVYAFVQFLEKKQFKAYLLVLATSIPLIFINPYTYHYFFFIFDELTSAHDLILEWEPVKIFILKDYIFFKMLVLLSLCGYIFTKKEKPDFVAVILLVSLGFFGLSSARHTILFAIVAGIFVYEKLSEIYQNLAEDTRNKCDDKYMNNLDFLLNKGFAVFFILLFIPTVWGINILNWKIKLSEVQFPVNSVEFIKKNKIQGNILLPFKWGNYATWRLYPQNLVSIDGRYVEIYPEAVFKENNDFYYAREGWEEVLKKYNPDILLLDWRYSPVYKKMLKNDKWKLVYKDDSSAVMLPADYADLNALYSTPKLKSSSVNHFDSSFLKN